MPERLTTALAGRYRIERELGAGGMATVYLAEDLKHKRRVALKVLKPELAAVLGAERFVQEITTTASLQHPHILPLFDSGTADGFLYYVMPFIEGETLRDKLNRETQLGVDEAVRIAREVADALDYAHGKGVIHRDIKPENILIQNGRPMVADFGIALAVSAAAGGRMTETGLSLGTPHYMSPEQATADKEISARSDVYSLASVLYETLAGVPPHEGGSAQQVIMRIIADTPRRVTDLRKSVPPNVAAALAKALEKLPADRFETAAKFADALVNPAFTTGHAGAKVVAPAGTGSIGAWVRNPWSWGATAAIAALAVTSFTRSGGDGSNRVTFNQKTFRSEAVYTARFAPDGQTIVYSSTGHEGTVPRLYVIRPDTPEPEPLGPDSTHLLSISSNGQLAVLTGARYIAHRLFQGTLATLPLGGGAPREVLAGVREADWSPDNASLAVTRLVDGVDHLEYPIGTVVHTSAGYLSDVRISPDGNRVAFFEHPVQWDDRGEVVIVDRTGAPVARSATYWAVEGLAWRPDGSGVVYAAAASVGSYSTMTIFTMDLRGRAHLAVSSAGGITIQDVSSRGPWLATRDEQRFEVWVRHESLGGERDLTWLDGSSNPVLSDDGRFVALSDQGATGGLTYTVLLRKTDGSPPARLGDGQPLAFSPDGRSLLVTVLSTPPGLFIYPTGPGQPRRLDRKQFVSLSYSTGGLFRDNERFFACGNLANQGARCFVGAISDGQLTPVTPEGTVDAVLSPDGKLVAAKVGDGFFLYPVDGGAPRPANGLRPDDLLVRWSPDGRELWINTGRKATISAFRVDPRSGRRTALAELGAANRTGARMAVGLTLADDPRIYGYRQTRYLSSLFTVEGAR